jgi:hypothetical protein
VINGAREAAATPFEVCEDAVAPLAMQRIEPLLEKAVVVHPKIALSR